MFEFFPTFGSDFMAYNLDNLWRCKKS